VHTIPDMKILVVLAHPDPASFNHAIAERAVSALEKNGHQIVKHDLYSERFDAILPSMEVASKVVLPPGIERYCRELADADGIIIAHPNWWGQPPAILKGYIDRVFRAGVAYKFAENDSGEGVPIGLLKARAALVFNTSNTPPQRESEVFGDPLHALWKQCIFDLCGVKNFHRVMFSVVVTSTAGQRQAWLDEVREIVSRHFPAVTSRAQAV
jgi:NAD(P)H dehydrogenase (quinone)